jgi:tetratricopeptide (TPR) repeat protein
LDAADAVRRIHSLRMDQDVAHELARTWTELQRLHRELSKPNLTTTERLEIARDVDVARTVSQAYAANARTEPVTVGGRAPTAAGRARARELAEAALARAPDSPIAHYLMGDLWLEADEPQQAEAEFRKALAGDPSAAGRIKLGAALRYQGRFPDALVELQEALRLDPGSARAHAGMGMLRRAERNLPAAIAAYREALRLDPDLIDAHNELAVSLANSGRLEEAAMEFRAITRIDPDSTIGFYNLAYALADLDRDVESAAALREVIRINPDHYNARFNLGELFRLEGKYDDSAAQFREYLRLAPDVPENQRNIRRARGYVQQFGEQ